MQVAPETEILRKEVQHKYTELAENPDQTFHFHHGRPLAEILNYPMDQVDAMPPHAVESFAGMGNPPRKRRPWAPAFAGASGELVATDKDDSVRVICALEALASRAAPHIALADRECEQVVGGLE